MQRLGTRRALAWTCVAIASWLGCGDRSEAPAPRVRVVLITVDTLRYDSFMGTAIHPSRMPLTRARARSGLIFERSYAATNTTQPTHASLFTGLHPWEHGVTRNGLKLAAAHNTVAECLREAGFETAAVVASYPLHRRFGLAQGFDRYEADFNRGRVEGSWEGEPIDAPHFFRVAHTVTERALHLLDVSRAPRQFLWLHYFDPHHPYGANTPRPLAQAALWKVARESPRHLPLLIERARALYEYDVKLLDRSLERVLDRLANESEFETHVVFTSDHGESFGEHGSLGHGTRVTPEQVHVPLFIVSPRVEAGRHTEPVGSIDVAATLVDLAGVRCEGIGGGSLVSGSPTGPVVGMRRTFAEPGKELRTDGSRVELEEFRFFAVTDATLYAGNSDGVVLDDTPGREPDEETTESLKTLFAALERAAAGTSALEELDAEAVEALRALGYVR